MVHSNGPALTLWQIIGQISARRSQPRLRPDKAIYNRPAFPRNVVGRQQCKPRGRSALTEKTA
eukprot:8769204-Pyramimonas_sp.AAC.1